MLLSVWGSLLLVLLWTPPVWVELSPRCPFVKRSDAIAIMGAWAMRDRVTHVRGSQTVD